MSKNRRRLGVAVLTSAAAFGAGGAVAVAATPTTAPPSLSAVQAKAAAAISLRVDDLNGAISKVNGDSKLGSDSAALIAYLQAGVGPLEALGQKIAADTSESAAATDYATIFTNYRVLALVLPAAHIAGAADQIDVTTVPRLTALATKAAARVNPSNQSVLQPLISDLNAQVASASSGTSGVAAVVLGYTPSQWNANHDLLGSGHSAMQSAQGDIAKARADLKQIAAVLEPGRTAQPSTPTTGA